jgi:hypothetical protein
MMNSPAFDLNDKKFVRSQRIFRPRTDAKESVEKEKLFNLNDIDLNEKS